MTGIVGSVTGGGSLKEMVSELHREPWYVTERVESGDVGLAIRHHGDRDPAHAVWRSGSKGGVVHGAMPNVEDTGEVMERLLDDPVDALPAIDGPFLVAAFDADSDRLVVATDKLGTRPCYYVTEGEFAVGSSVGALLDGVDDPTVDERGISDLLMIGHVWGEKTLVEEVSYLPSGSVLEYEDGDVTVERYWEHEFGERTDPGFVPDLVEAYRKAVGDTASTLGPEVGLWLSGGLDSRAMGTELSRHRDVTSFTYDANPAGGSNPELARRVADTLGIANAAVDLAPGGFVDAFEDCVALTDGLVGMITFVNLSAVFNVPEEHDVGAIIEACGQGGMMGDGIKGSTIKRASSAEDALYRAKSLNDADTVRRVLDSDFDPMSTYRVEVEKSDQPTRYTTVMDCYYRNYFSRGDFGSNPLARSQFGTRVPFAHGEFLEHMTKLPVSYRTRTFPYTKIPVGTSRMKLELVRRLNGGLEKIPYERTKLPPTYPEWAHGLGFVYRTGTDRLRGTITFGGRSMMAEWYRSHHGFRNLVDTLLDDATDRPFLDGGEIRQAQRETVTGEDDHMTLLSGVVTAESWLQQHL